MNTKLMALFLGALTVLPMAALAVPKPVSVYPAKNEKLNGPAGKSQVVHLYLVQKNPEAWTEIIQNGAWGKLQFNRKNGKLVFNGHKLQPGVEYSLINYAPEVDWETTPDANPWPGATSVLLASGIANKAGNLNLKGTLGSGITGKVWLVPSSDYVQGTGMVAWNPTKILFEYALV